VCQNALASNDNQTETRERPDPPGTMTGYRVGEGRIVDESVIATLDGSVGQILSENHKGGN
jgi:hypothetical protein